MGYTMKWVIDNLGITRDMIRYYEEKKLLPKNESGKYRKFSDEDIERIWGIKLLIEIGFSTKEIESLMRELDFDFDAVMADKVAELERKHKESATVLNFAKSIRLTGRIPTTSKYGSIKFEDFIAYAHENWNFYEDPRTTSFARLTDVFASKSPKEWGPKDIARVLELFEDLKIGSFVLGCVLNGYFQVIADMQEFGYTSDPVQRVVRLLHEYLVKSNTEPELDGRITPQFVGKYVARSFLGGEMAASFAQEYGKDGCMFIAQALAYYGGVDLKNI